MKKFVLLVISVSSITINSFAQASQQNDKEKDVLSTTNDFQSFSDGVQARFSSSSLPSFQYKESTKGSRYLFNNWVKGVVTNKEGAQFSEGYVFNFDKIAQNLYMKIRDTAVAILVDRGQLHALTLQGENRIEALEKVASLNTDNFYNVLSKGKKYSLYRLTKTTFIPSNYESNGITSTGNLYDEYKEEYKYYLVYADGTSKEITVIKSKIIKSLFPGDKSKVETFYKDHEDANVDEKFFQLLVEYLNS